ncbi:MAG: hypothetical protein AAB413_03545, partial [Patescibacteria group bacterium]
ECDIFADYYPVTLLLDNDKTIDKNDIFKYIPWSAFLSDLVKPAQTTLISPGQNVAAQGGWR